MFVYSRVSGSRLGMDRCLLEVRGMSYSSSVQRILTRLKFETSGRGRIAASELQEFLTYKLLNHEAYLSYLLCFFLKKKD